MNTEEQFEVKVTFCDHSQKEEMFAPTAWGRITARETFLDYTNLAEDNNSVFGRYPHVLSVFLHTPDQDYEEKYACEHTRAQRRSTA